MRSLPENVELYRDRKWRRDEMLRIDSAEAAEQLIDDLGFCLGLTDIRKGMPSLYIAVCGRRDAHLPRNVQKDEESSRAWVLKDELVARGNVYYAKLLKGRSWFLSRRMIPVFNSLYGCSKQGESGILSANARRVLAVLRKEWEMATSDLRSECGFKDKADLTKALDELQRRMKVVPQEVLYVPKFTYVWTLAEARFPSELKKRMDRDRALSELAQAYLSAFGMTLRGELAGKFGLGRAEAGKANHALVDTGAAVRAGTGIYSLPGLV